MYSITCRAIVIVIATILFSNLHAQDASVDLLIRNARVIDGTIMAYGRGQPHPRSYGTFVKGPGAK